jgi:hypothetical protein
MKSRSLRLWSGLFPIAVTGLLVMGQTAANAETAARTRMHVVNKHAHVSFYVPTGFVHQSAASYMEESLWNKALDVQILIQSPHGAVSIADGDIFLKSWLADTNLKIGQSTYVREHYGTVARLVFTNQPAGDEFPLTGIDLRFLDGSRSYDVVVDSTSSSEAAKTATLILRTWGT